ncbi:amino acid transporter [Francisella halioticida]|uniref:Amino acid transporter n=1 Tax=Francisella halioticida TaxID=549298 RepID=A0ABN5AWP3_9GAMM|nr:aromatic amino acid transport family protein [Francisella halioticida]ASG67127.1 amino acid transporter [Francisella halioticida]
MILSRKFGAAMIISGTCIGAGMLAIPATVASCGFFIGSILIISVWALMTFTALVLAEVNLEMNDGSNFIEMTSKTLGPFGVGIVWVCYVLLLYSLVAAYTVGGGSLLSTTLNRLGISLSEKFTGIIFILILGVFIYISTRVVDHVNKLMLTGKLLAFFLLIAVLIPHVSTDHLTYQIKNPNFIRAAFPILLTSFGFHHIIPTLRTYVGSNRSFLRQAIILGSSVPLVIYLLWIFATLGSLPVATPTGILGKESGEIASVIVTHFKGTSSYISTISFLFGFFALATSFLGVALGLFDFNRSTYRISKNLHKHKVLAFIITFLPAYLYAIIYPDGFKSALGYASIFVAVLQVALPVMMLTIINYRKKKDFISTSAITVVVVAIAVIIISLQIFNSFELLPTLN